MPTIVTHAAIPLAIGFGLGRKRIPGRLLAVGIAAAMLPDIDVFGRVLDIPFDSIMGHRGVTHSLFFAGATAVGVAYASSFLKVNGWLAALFTFICIASHGLLDMATTGGPGIALYWPWSEERLFFPWQFIKVSPLSLDGFLSKRGMDVIMSELAWVWFPCMALMLAFSLHRAHTRKRLLAKIASGQSPHGKTDS